MAFQMPQQRPRPVSTAVPPSNEPPSAVTVTSLARTNTIEASQEWVLFSPATDQTPSTSSAVARTHTTSSQRTPRTAGRSQLSDFGSLDTAARSGGYGAFDDDQEDEEQDIEEDDDVTCQGTDTEDDDGEDLDSLDDGLHAFHSHQHGSAGLPDTSGGTVLPTHDGLGTFPASSRTVQEQLYQFETYNPGRRYSVSRHRRRSSVQRRLDAIEAIEEEREREEEKRQRIENWRLEQSRALLEEIERETRRRRRKLQRHLSNSKQNLNQGSPAATVGPRPTGTTANTTAEAPASESFWQRVTRKVIRDLIGIDEQVLAVIFGEALPEEVASPPTVDIIAAIEKEDFSGTELAQYSGAAWEIRLLERISMELGVLINQLSDHPGAFSTYKVGLADPFAAPVTINDNKAMATLTEAYNEADILNDATPDASHYAQPAESAEAQERKHAAHWGIEDEDDEPPMTARQAAKSPITLESDRSRREQEYWERELDIKTAFKFLRSRFVRSSSLGQGADATQTRPPVFRSDSDGTGAARRAALIRHHHPLVSKNMHAHQRSQLAGFASPGQRRRGSIHQSPSTFLATDGLNMLTAAGAAAARRHRDSLGSGVLKRSGSSCASQSTKKSKSSSRNYWDIGAGSVGSGPVGTWGEM